MKRAIKSFLGIKSKSKKDKDHPSENITTSTVNSTLNSAGDPHRHSSNSNQASVIVHDATSESYGPQPTRNTIEVQRRQRSSATGESSRALRPRPQSEIAHNNRTRTHSEQTEILAARRLYFHQPQLIDRGAGASGPASASHNSIDGNLSNKSSQDHIISTRGTTIAAATQALTPPLAQDRGYGTDPRQEAGPDDNDYPLSTRNSSDDSCNQTLKRKTQLCDPESLQSTPLNVVHANSSGEDKRETFRGKVELVNKRDEMDLTGVYNKTTPFQHQHNRLQGHQDREQGYAQGQGQTQGSSKAPQYRSPDLERTLSPVPDPGPAPNPTSQADSKKRFSLSSLTSRAIFNKRSDTPASKGKGTNRSNTQSDISDKGSPEVRQFDLDVDQFIRDNTILGLEKHPYRVGLDYELQLQALAYATNLAEARETDQMEPTLQQSKEGTTITLEDPVSVVPQESVPITSQPRPPSVQPRPLSIQSKGPPSIPLLSISDSPPSRITDTSESKRLSNTSRGTSHRTAHRIVYSADLANGLPKGHIAREGNYEIVPTKRFSASSAKTNNTSSKSYTTTHVMTTADNMDGVPGGPAPSAVTLIIRPENRGKSHRIITTATTASAANKQEFNNTFGRSSVFASINSVGSSESGEHGSEQFMSIRTGSTLGGDTKQSDFGTSKKRAEGQETGPERALVDFLGKLSPESKAGM
ncbi:hypothetical protein BGZ96_004810 [Linnemannia gamsii]|uniref:Uncharacterized protein n=1 Tax=Linnemannia gamsii TaxID=64522 RepID=A0ABQ7K622_9FUNG|nr:hypothetical protein BGZ96_004810 [Linnemannia gamsii]